ncbi:MAG: nucleoside monophosphate kinase [Candidatus Latescibacterota bacterium]
MKKRHVIPIAFLIAVFCLSCSDDNIDTKEDIGLAASPQKAPLQLIMLGTPGAGKTTQAQKLNEKFAIPQISGEELLRAEADRRTMLGEEIEEVMRRGELANDDIIFRLIQARLSELDCANGFILEGYPETVAQAKELDTFLRARGHTDMCVLYIMVTEEIAIERMMAKRNLSDTEEALVNRIKAYHEQTAPLIDYYFERGSIIRINGVQTNDEVFHEIEERLAKLGWE